MINDKNLVYELRMRNEDALNFIIDCYGNLLFKISYQYLNSSELSKECINEVLLKIWISIEQYDPEKSNFLTWISSITKYTAIDILKKEKKHYKDTSLNKKLNSNFDDIEKNYIAKNELIDIIQNINSFEKIDKEIFLLRFFLMKDITTISNQLNLTPNAVSLRILRARKKLRSSVLEKYEIT
ncbi:sigma-70 family RNA polymerase sigma factor [Clostridium sp. LP20]|uniref:sigma-70 family RNA polymerase sigma factor n=1 Tax=Clostridium sp. LP20 TaxID=3418665 RepID=UPI003EE4DE57